MSCFPVAKELAFSNNVCPAFEFWKSWKLECSVGQQFLGGFGCFKAGFPVLFLFGPITLVAKLNQGEDVPDV